MKIGLLGHGVVGSGVRKIIDENKTDALKGLEVKKILVKDESEIIDASRMTTVADEVLDDPEIDIIVECMGGIEPARSFALRALNSGKHFVTSNKKMLANSLAELLQAAQKNHVSVHYEASCGGGIPWMNELARTKRIDEIDAFHGIFNGTTNYILNRMYLEGKDFDDMLKDAQSLGYAERDPSDDIDGFDVQYKVALSCAKAFNVLVEPKDIPVFGIRHITKEDLDFCKANGYVAKLIGKGIRNQDEISAMVMPMFVKQSNMLSNIPLNFNAIESVSKTLGPAVYVGQGAGSLPTAHAVVQDLIDISRNENCEEAEMKKSELVNDVYGTYYIRAKDLSVFDEVKDQKCENAILTKQVSFSEIEELIRKADDETLFIAEVEA